MMNWLKASRTELLTIAYYDDAATLKERLAAAEELKRRNRRQLQNELQNKERKVYPR